ncbi:MAG: bidirectional hydrogenase complex protein HoxE [candidate division Zixibacteria bacterium]|nr:bidirectional hydrogenase complex protein HoxE [candidate division Zixibacteria bacterium]
MFDFTRPDPPSDDKRWKLVLAEMRKNGYAQNSLIQCLHAVQSSFGFLDEESMRFVANALRLPLSKVYGVATFYHYFTMKPPGKHTCVLCTGTACYIKGVPELLKAIKEKYKIKLGETTEDGELSLLSARCVGACGLAPVAVIDGEAVGKLTPDQLLGKLKEAIG